MPEAFLTDDEFEKFSNFLKQVRSESREIIRNCEKLEITDKPLVIVTNNILSAARYIDSCSDRLIKQMNKSQYVEENEQSKTVH